MNCAIPLPMNIRAGISIQNHQPRPAPVTPRTIEMARKAMPMNNFVSELSRLIRLPLLLVQPFSICNLPDRTSETLPRSVPQLRQNFPSSGFLIPHFGQNIVLFLLKIALSSGFEKNYARGDRNVQGIYFSIHRDFHQRIAVLGN